MISHDNKREIVRFPHITPASVWIRAPIHAAAAAAAAEERVGRTAWTHVESQTRKSVHCCERLNIQLPVPFS